MIAYDINGVKFSIDCDGKITIEAPDTLDETISLTCGFVSLSELEFVVKNLRRQYEEINQE